MAYTALLTQQCTYWAPASNDGFGGLVYSAPVSLLVRWQDKVELLQDTAGEEFLSSAIVYSSQELAENGFLYEGTSAEANPQDQEGAFRIRLRGRSPTPSADIVVYKNTLG